MVHQVDGRNFMSAKKALMVGFIANSIFLIIAAYLFQTFAQEISSNGLGFLNSLPFFIGLMLFVPLVFLCFKRYYYSLGGILSIVGYFLLFIPLAMLIGN